MEIQKYNPNSIAVFDGSEKSILKAIESNLVNQLDNDTIEEKLIDLVNKTHLIAGIKHSGDIRELNTTVSEIIAELRFNKTNIRINEIEIAFQNGVHKKYGDYFGLNAVTFCGFIKSYILDPTRLEAIKLKNMTEEKKQPTLQERFETAKNLALTAYDKFDKGQSIELEGATVYRFLAGLKVIVYDDEEQAQFMTGATNEVIAKKNLEKVTSMDKNVRNLIQKQLDDISLLSEKIKLTAQHNGLVQYFEILKFESETPKATLLNLINEQAKQYLNK